MNWSDSAGQFTQSLHALTAAGVRVPILHEAPALSARAALAMTIWRDLCGERAFTGNGMGPIPWRAIVAWCDRYAVPNAEEIVELVQAADAEWLRHAGTISKPSSNSGTGARQVRH